MEAKIFTGFGSCETNETSLDWISKYSKLDLSTDKNKASIKNLEKNLGYLRIFCNKDLSNYFQQVLKDEILIFDDKNDLKLNVNTS